MIHIKRARIGAPEILRSKRAKAVMENAQRYYASARSDRAQQRHAFEEDIWLKASQTLRKLFHGKCAYCEKRFERTEKVQVDHFRPTVHAKQLSGAPTPDHYCWLAYDYSNLYPSCAECHRHKGTIFPVGKERVSIGATGKDLLSEQALLIDLVPAVRLWEANS